jgi:hypothetical protein
MTGVIIFQVFRNNPNFEREESGSGRDQATDNDPFQARLFAWPSYQLQLHTSHHG